VHDAIEDGVGKGRLGGSVETRSIKRLSATVPDASFAAPATSALSSARTSDEIT
jgi:hypothetical protein